MLSIFGCSCAMDVATNSTTSNTTNYVEKEPQTIELSVDNIGQYIAFTTEVSDVEVLGRATSNEKRGYGQLKVKTTRKQKVEFENLVITFKLQPESSSKGRGWDKVCSSGSNDEFTARLEIPYDGSWEENFKIQSDLNWSIDSEPDLKVVVMSVSGKAIKE